MIKGLHHNAYRCRDSEETRRFYEDFLGLPLVNALRDQGDQERPRPTPTSCTLLRAGRRLVPRVLRGAGHAVRLQGAARLRPAHRARGRARRARRPMFAKGKAAGIETRGISDHEFIDSIYFRDPNGYVIELTAKRPITTSAWIRRRTAPARSSTAGRPPSASRHGRRSRPRWRKDQETTEETMGRMAWAALAALLGVCAFSSSSIAADPPQFQVDPFWPKPLPNNWISARRPAWRSTRGPCLGAAAPAVAHRG